MSPKIKEGYGSVPAEREKPSLKFSLEMTEEYKQKKAILEYQKVRDIIECSEIENKPVVVQSSPMKILVDVDFSRAVN